MNKIKKYLIVSGLASLLLLLAVAPLSAATKDFVKAVPTMQRWEYVGAAVKDVSSNFGYVTLTTQTSADGLTFYAYPTTSGTLGGPKIVKNVNVRTSVSYADIYGVGQVMNCKFRNTNWSLNSNAVAGTFNYR